MLLRSISCICLCLPRFPLSIHLPNQNFYAFLVAFVKLRKVTISFVMSVFLSLSAPVRTEKLGSHWTDFHEILYLSIFPKFVEKIQVSLRSDQNILYFQ